VRVVPQLHAGDPATLQIFTVMTNWTSSGHSRWDLVTKYGKSQHLYVLNLGVMPRCPDLQ
jgi:hypothetical protein